MRRFLLACAADLMFGFLWVWGLYRAGIWENRALLIPLGITLFSSILHRGEK